MAFDIENLKKKHSILLFFDLFFLFAPGALALFYFYRDLFFQLDIFKLGLLTLSFHGPFVFLDTILLHDTFDKEDKDSFFMSLSIASIISGTAFYMAMAIAYVVGQGFREFSISLILIQLAFFCLSYLENIKSKRGAKSSKK